MVEPRRDARDHPAFPPARTRGVRGQVHVGRAHTSPAVDEGAGTRGSGPRPPLLAGGSTDLSCILFSSDCGETTGWPASGRSVVVRSECRQVKR